MRITPHSKQLIILACIRVTQLRRLSRRTVGRSGCASVCQCRCVCVCVLVVAVNCGAVALLVYSSSCTSVSAASTGQRQRVIFQSVLDSAVNCVQRGAGAAPSGSTARGWARYLVLVAASYACAVTNDVICDDDDDDDDEWWNRL